MGAMTGRGAGYCAGYDTTGTAGYPTFGRGFGMGYGRGGFRGRGGGFRWRYRFQSPDAPPWMRFSDSFPNGSPDSEQGFLQRRAESLKSELTRIQSRLAQMGKPADAE